MTVFLSAFKVPSWTLESDGPKLPVADVTVTHALPSRVCKRGSFLVLAAVIGA